MSDLPERTFTKRAVVVAAGLRYVGLPLAAEFPRAGLDRESLLRGCQQLLDTRACLRASPADCSKVDGQ